MVLELKKKNRGRLLSDLFEIDASLFFETSIVVNSEEKKSDMNYYMTIKDWTEKEIIVKYNFKQPLAISKDKKRDSLSFKIKKSANKYFVSAEHLKTLDLKASAKEEKIVEVKKQVPLGGSAENMERSVQSSSGGITSLIIVQIVLQIFMKGSMYSIFDFFLHLQII